MGRISRIHLIPPAVGIVFLAFTLLLRRDGWTPRRPDRTRSSRPTAGSVPPSVKAAYRGTVFLSPDSDPARRNLDGGACARIDGSDFAGVSWEAAIAYSGRALSNAALADFEVILAMEGDPLTSDSMEKDLELTPAQKARIDDLRARFKIEEELWRTHSLLESEVDRKLDELRDRYRSLIRQELSPEQQRKYDELDAASPRNRWKYAILDLERLSQIQESTDP